ncbi:uncharacterized protein LOC123683032 [Harmonia axyridis]|uniref:uncharacterized protein LOC123683032 n=1 Tax=Harmonia axyridis TaxID=115357 RepID=UPI001E275DB4|nr:uncharacterized protein LOC123683032 [Harmonia axyridis]
MTDFKLKRAKFARTSCIGELASLLDLANKATTDSNLRTSFRIRFTEIDDVREEFNKQHQTVTSILLQGEDTDLDSEEAIKREFQNDYFSVKTIYTQLFDPNEKSLNESTQSVLTRKQSLASCFPHSLTPNIRLPQIEIKKFRGDYTQFATFLDVFDALVHNNQSLTEIEKFNYLISSLEGPPLSLVRTLPMTSDNYQIAYDSLVNRFSNERLRAQAHWNAIESTGKINCNNQTALRNLLSTFTENLAALKNMNFPVESWDFIVFMLLIKRLDNSTIARFELENGSSMIPEFKTLLEFLNKYCIAMDTLGTSHNSNNTRTGDSNSSSNSKQRIGTYFSNDNKNQRSKSTCTLCNQDHSLLSCSKFIEKTPQERHSFAKQKHLCFNCLSNIHDLRSCKSVNTCRKCHQRHHTLLHLARPSSETSAGSEEPPSTSSDWAVLSASAGVSHKTPTVLLSTALIEVRDNFGMFHRFRCLIDSGSMSSFITRKAANLLGLPRHKLDVEVKGLNSMKMNASYGSLVLMFRPYKLNGPVLLTDAIILDRICDEIPSHPIPVSAWSHLAHIKLADESFHTPGKIDILLGADVFSKIMLTEQIIGKPGQIDAMNTIFGYILMGKFYCKSKPSISTFLTSCSDFSTDISLQKFWELDSLPSVEPISPDNKLCDQIFSDQHYRDSEGRYVVSLPFRSCLPQFTGMRELALQRFFTLERRLLKTPDLYKLYVEFMRDYLESNHMEIIPYDCINRNSYYLPHHCVVKAQNSQSKIRVVFNASAKSPCSEEGSLNDHLLTGKKLQRDIISILLRFRLHEYTVCADIRQMYRMIRIRPDHADYQRIIWRFSVDEAPQDYRLLTVTYGVNSAPYLALRTLIQLTDDEGPKFPLASKALLENTYVDDIVAGSSSLEGAKLLLQQLVELLNRGNFELRKFSSNCPSVLAGIPSSHMSADPLTFDQEDEHFSLKILGLQWDPKGDCFRFSFEPLNKSSTKRHLLSQIARIYDPIGFLAPVTFLLKHLLQRVWSSGIDWDDELPPDIARVWDAFKSQIQILSSITIPRKLLSPKAKSYQLVGFCDASERGYCAVVYNRMIDDNDQPNNNFLCAKTKVSPLKRITIPRLELCGAVLLAKLLSYCLHVFRDSIDFCKVYAFTDSQITLDWIKGSPHRWPTFVANRVAHIQEKVPSASWYHIDSKNNPADAGSRGLLPSEFAYQSIWFDGPQLLHTPSSSFPVNIDIDVTTQQNINNFCSKLSDKSAQNIIISLLDSISSLTRIQRILAYVLRFTHNAKKESDKLSGNLTLLELNESLFQLVRVTQQHAFSTEVKGNTFPKHWQKLKIFLDERGISRVGGRIDSSSLSFESKHPMLLPKKSRLTALVVDMYHKKYLHAGLRTLRFLIAQRFWIISGRKAISSVLNRCLKCFKIRPKPYQPPMGALPKPRISEVKPFSNCGVDFAGPYSITIGRHRGVKTVKAYVCLFVCFATKALHLELATDLSTETFLSALQRLIARRGRISHLYSDCGTNFVGANREIINLMKDSAEREHIQWHFNPPSAPHMGGLWEAGVKSVKTHLSRVIGAQILTYEEFYTVLCLIEAILNSRPLEALSSDPEDVSALSPGHFLTLEPLNALPYPDITQLPLNRLSRWQCLQRIQQDFWKRWQREYLHTLQQCSKWYTPDNNPPKLGDLVLIKDERLPPCQWALGRISSLSNAIDGRSRIATVKTRSGFLKRPVVKLFPLPVEI